MNFKLLVIPVIASLSVSFAHAQSGQGGGSMQAPSATQTTTNLTQEEVAEILKTANDAEIDMAQAAKRRAENKEVKDFAKHMEEQHKENNKEAKKITKKADIDMKNNDTAKSLKKDAKDKLADLKKKKGADFDKAYIENQIAMHEMVLRDLNEKFIPAVQNPEFKAFLETTKSHVQEHLSKAQQIQQSLNQ
ncbi:DUF4142 domain-containing protein [Bdellovibrio reynosensis]|uniref:DUF4142 domain-containing protein n=1 Tax=Bdellovibrio reynosensis TaxID=2835041 RepID=A0ABY4CB54_9BACT|nr:DUF4142 domain-containing protein [Bdellovibrio reynosensis]UOF00926.1 DUF4142 domain-containing protein [Bdellovibrio reynosensis]